MVKMEPELMDNDRTPYGPDRSPAPEELFTLLDYEGDPNFPDIIVQVRPLEDEQVTPSKQSTKYEPTIRSPLKREDIEEDRGEFVEVTSENDDGDDADVV